MTARMRSKSAVAEMTGAVTWIHSHHVKVPVIVNTEPLALDTNAILRWALPSKKTASKPAVWYDEVARRERKRPKTTGNAFTKS